LTSVPKEQLAKGHRISIPFRYEWESASPDVEHRTFFYASEMPEQFGALRGPAETK